VGAAREAALIGMDGPRATLLAAVVANVLGWVLTAAMDVRGWEAFAMALSPLWSFDDFADEPVWFLILIVASALTNLLFIALAGLLLRGRRPKAVLWTAAAATLLNLHWVATLGLDRRYLAGGYFIWVCSFALLALSACLVLRPARRYVKSSADARLGSAPPGLGR
jgi:hypothetical protein